MMGLRYAKLGALLAVVLAGTATGCATVPLGFAGVVYVAEAPPPQRREVVSERPDAGFVWIQGYWVRSSDSYDWVPGRWERAPQPRQTWQPGRWKRHNRNGWYWAPGRWR